MILACRSVERAEAARDDIINTTGNNDVIVMSLDLGSLRSIKQFAEDFNRSALFILKKEIMLSIYIAPYGTIVLLKRSGMDHTVLTANYTMPAFPS